MAYQYRLNQITFSDKTTLNLPNLTVLVGANNCGKSRALKDIVSMTCATDKKNGVVVKHALVPLPPNAKTLSENYGIATLNEGDTNCFRYLHPMLDREESVAYAKSMQWPEGFDLFVKQRDQFGRRFGCQLKRVWINRALHLVPSLEINLAKQPWRLMADIHAHLQKSAPPQ